MYFLRDTGDVSSIVQRVFCTAADPEFRVPEVFVEKQLKLFRYTSIGNLQDAARATQVFNHVSHENEFQLSCRYLMAFLTYHLDLIEENDARETKLCYPDLLTGYLEAFFDRSRRPKMTEAGAAVIAKRQNTERLSQVDTPDTSFEGLFTPTCVMVPLK